MKSFFLFVFCEEYIWTNVNVKIIVQKWKLPVRSVLAQVTVTGSREKQLGFFGIKMWGGSNMLVRNNITDEKE